MIFTIGHKKTYQKARKQLLENPQAKDKTVYKQGKDKNYCGGYAFLTRDAAQHRIDSSYPNDGFAVFGLDADWNQDTYPNPAGGWWHNLLTDKPIIFLD